MFSRSIIRLSGSIIGAAKLDIHIKTNCKPLFNFMKEKFKTRIRMRTIN